MKMAILGIVATIVLGAGCASRTQANVGMCHAGFDVTVHENWDLSLDVGDERTTVGLGLVTVGVDANLEKSDHLFAFSHATDLINDTGNGNGNGNGKGKGKGNKGGK